VIVVPASLKVNSLAPLPPYPALATPSSCLTDIVVPPLGVALESTVRLHGSEQVDETTIGRAVGRSITERRDL